MPATTYRVLITGSKGFIGSNLLIKLRELSSFSVSTFDRGDSVDVLQKILAQSDAVIHLAGENRPKDDSAYERTNVGLTISLCDAIRNEYISSGRKIQLILASSTQATLNNPYGSSKLAAENVVHNLCSEIKNSVVIFRLPGVFGKWCKPNYNSVVATFCFNIARELPIYVKNPNAQISLVYVDDVVRSIVAELTIYNPGLSLASVSPEYLISLNELATQIREFHANRTELFCDKVGVGFTRALYATFISYLPIDEFSYEIPVYADERGMFVEMLKTSESGQFSCFTARPGITRGGHYHHTKTEKFLVVKGRARFRFKHLLTGQSVVIYTTDDKPRVVDTIPGWSHDITNIGDVDMVVLLWANENFDRNLPDTIMSKV